MLGYGSSVDALLWYGFVKVGDDRTQVGPDMLVDLVRKLKPPPVSAVSS
jgi:hypothetical protein